jgi:hypothetical protein
MSESAGTPSDVASACAALAAQVFELLPQARPGLSEARYAEIAARAGQIRQEALRGVNDKTLVEDKPWLDQTIADLLGVINGNPRAGPG